MDDTLPELLITGAAGQLGSVLCDLARRGQLPAEARFRPWGTVTPGGARPAGIDVLEADLRDPEPLIERVVQRPPAAIIHLAAVSRVDVAYGDPVLAQEVNVEATGELCHLAARVGARFVFASTDMVFEGTQAPYAESDTPHPQTTYGRTKLAAEAHVLANPAAVVARLPLLFGIPPLRPERSHLWNLARRGSETAPANLFHDEFRTPMSLADAAACLCRLAATSALTGVVHLAGHERVSRLELGQRWATQLGRHVPVASVSARAHPSPEPRPEDLSLSAERYCAHFGQPPTSSLDDALARCAADLAALEAHRA